MGHLCQDLKNLNIQIKLKLLFQLKTKNLFKVCHLKKIMLLLMLLKIFYLNPELFQKTKII